MAIVSKLSYTVSPPYCSDTASSNNRRTISPEQKDNNTTAETRKFHRSKTLTDPKHKLSGAHKEKTKSETENSLLDKFLNRSIRFEVIKELHTVVAKIIDRKTGKVIKEIPPEELLEIAKRLNSKGRLLSREA